MTIKKPMKTVVKTGAAPAAGGAAGSATIADRFKLDAPEPPRKAGGKGDTVALIAGLLSLVVAGILTYVLYQHWEFLMPA